MLLIIAALIASITAPARPIVIGKSLDCSAGYEALLASLPGKPGAKPMPLAADQLYGVYEVSPERAIYTFTVQGNPAHPALVKRQIVSTDGGVQLETSACGYGDARAFDKMMVEFQSLNAGVKRSVGD